MRRRDATGHDSLFLEGRTRWVSAAAVSALLHTALLVTAALLVPRSHFASLSLIRVSLLAGGGAAHGGDLKSGASTTSPAPIAPAAPVAPSVQQAPPRQHPLGRATARHVHAAHALVRPSDDHVETAAVADVTTVNGARAQGAGGGSGSGPETAVGASGAGLGGGDGTGNGGGQDQRAHCVYCPEPQYPLVARARGWQGTVDVGLMVLADGSVDAASLRRSSGHAVLDEAAITVARHSRFSPPGGSGLPTPLRGRIQYRFELSH